MFENHRIHRPESSAYGVPEDKLSPVVPSIFTQLFRVSLLPGLPFFFATISKQLSVKAPHSPPVGRTQLNLTDTDEDAWY